VALSHYCCRTTLQCQRHETVLELSVDRVRQPIQYSLGFCSVLEFCLVSGTRDVAD